MISVVVPAHNEEAVISDCLEALIREPTEDDLEIIVVANGCTDRTAETARNFGTSVRVLEIPTPSKVAALNAGDLAAGGFPRVYLDADVRIDAADLVRLVAPLQEEGVSVTAPRRRLRDDASSWLVRSYLRVWSSLPHVQSSLSGTGVLAVSEVARSRFDSFPEVISDDLYLETIFPLEERRIVEDAEVLVEAPRTLKALVHRRTRVVRGVRELSSRREGDQQVGSNRPSELLAAMQRHPGLAIHVPTFVAVTVVARLRASWMARRRATSWERDESTRTRT